MKSSKPLGSSSGLMGTKNGTCGELSRSIQIFFRIAGSSATIGGAGVSASVISIVGVFRGVSWRKGCSPALRHSVMRFGRPVCLLPHHFDAQAAQDLADDAALLFRLQSREHRQRPDFRPDSFRNTETPVPDAP